MQRRNFLQSLGMLSASGLPVFGSEQPVQIQKQSGTEREYWTQTLSRIAEPLLTSLAAGTLKEKMPVEVRRAELLEKRKKFTHLEGFGRLLCGMAPWIELPGYADPEGTMRARYFALSLQSLANAVDPRSKDYMNFSDGTQPVVDASFLAFALIRSPRLWKESENTVQQNILRAFRETRRIKPHHNNWLLFSAMIEAFFITVGEEFDPMRIDYAVRQHEQWYKGDGIFGDGPEFHFDYYNSYVIQPYITAILDIITPVDTMYAPLQEKCSKIALRYAAIQERLIGQDGTFPAVGRSVAYRCGAFHHLAHQALAKKLPEGISLSQVRCALTAVIRATLDNPGNYDSGRWLRPGLNGFQPDLAEDYISTGSLYLCAAAFLPLGLPAADEFWTQPSSDWTAKKAWSGKNLPADKALKI